MRIERDESKAASNVKRRRVSFDDAVTIFCDLLAATFGDPDHSQEESRLIAVGYSGNQIRATLALDKAERIGIR